MAVSTTSGIRDDLHLHTLGTQIDGNVRSPTESAAVAAPQRVDHADAAPALDGEAVLAMDVWQGVAAGSRALTGGVHMPGTAGLAPRAAIDTTAAYVLAALG